MYFFIQFPYNVHIATYSTDAGVRITLISGLVVVAFMAFGLAISVYRIAVFDSSVEEIEAHNAEIERRIASKEREILYYQSDQFKNKFAKEKLQLVSPGEHVLIIDTTRTPGELLTPTDIEASRELKFEESLRTIPTIKHWQLYLFHQGNLEDLRSGNSF